MNKTALITGAPKRIGRAIAEHLAGQGWSLVIHFNRSALVAQQLADDLSKQYPGQQFRTVKADLSKTDEVTGIIPYLVSKSVTVDLLVNNASVFDRGYLGETTAALFDNQMDVNLKAPFFLVRDFANYYKKGNIINLVDTRISSNSPDYAAYSLSKKALWELTKMAALEFAPAIRVNAIAPGATLPPEEKDENYLLEMAAKTPMKKPGGVQPVLDSIDFILTNRHLTGQLLFADGGENLGRQSSPGSKFG